MRRFAILSALALHSTAVIAQTPSDEAALAAAAAPWKFCVLQEITRTDDRVSDAATVATVIAPRCREAYATFKHAAATGKPAHEYLRIMRKMDRDELRYVTDLVLTKRRERPAARP